jgi:GNAT superfamily N-acetyltransferase
VAATLRLERPGDLGWVFHRQAAIYARDFGYSRLFEVYVARGLAPFMDDYDERRDRLWIAEVEGRPVGSITIHHDKERPRWAKLRWYFVEPEARGKGAGRILLDEAVAFSRRAGYEGIALWTVNDLDAARRQYERAGFRLAFEDTKPCPWAPWGREQRWELHLRTAPEA